MKVQNILPDKQIREYVDRILVIENNVFLKPFVLPLYANGVPTLLFKSVKGKLGTKSSCHLTLFGQTIAPEFLTLDENFTLIAYFFKPHTLLSLFGIAGYELTDKPTDLHLLPLKNTQSLQDQLLNSGSIANMLEHLNNYIASLGKASKSILPSVVYASEKIARHYTSKSLAEIQKELHITERTFQRMFEKYIGVSPNAYRRVCQFNSAFVDLNLGNFLHLSDIAFQHGYADQSHYIRAFKEFTTISPSEYLNYGS